MKSGTIGKLRELSQGWGEMPSTTPHPETAPQLTTGHAIWLANKAADEIETLTGTMREVMRLSAEPGGEVRKLDEIHRYACAALQGRRV